MFAPPFFCLEDDLIFFPTLKAFKVSLPKGMGGKSLCTTYASLSMHVSSSKTSKDIIDSCFAHGGIAAGNELCTTYFS